MLRLTRVFLLLISLAVLTVAQAQSLLADDSLLPKDDGGKASYSAYIQMPKAYVSGVCMMVMEQGCLRASLFNEFGISAIDFTFTPKRNKVKVVHVMKMLDKWYIKRVLRHDLRELLCGMSKGLTEYKNLKRGLTYSLTPMPINKQEPNAQDLQHTE